MTIQLHTAGWPTALADDVSHCTVALSLSALSFLPPRAQRFDPFTRLWLAIDAAARRGVILTVAMPAPTLAHPATLRNDSAAATLRSIGAVVSLVPPTNLLHAKSVIIDHAIAWVGSGNFTAAAAHHNRECWLRTDDAQVAADLRAFHGELMKAGS